MDHNFTSSMTDEELQQLLGERHVERLEWDLSIPEETEGRHLAKKYLDKPINWG